MERIPGGLLWTCEQGLQLRQRLVPTLQSSNKPLGVTSHPFMIQGMLEISPERLKWAWFRNHGGQRMAADEVRL